MPGCWLLHGIQSCSYTRGWGRGLPAPAGCSIAPHPVHPTPPGARGAGVARTILVRLLLGLLGYGAVSAWFPFMPPDIWFLLSAVVALGLFSGIVFSASYQLVGEA